MGKSDAAASGTGKDNPNDNKQGRPDRQILKSTFIMGWSSIIMSLMGVVRTKIIVLILGTTGVGLTGIYLTVTDLVRTFSGLGVRESGVRQIAGAVGTGDGNAVSRTILTVRRAALITGLAGLAGLVVFSGETSSLTFGNRNRAGDFVVLSLLVLFTTISSGQAAVIQGMRRIADLAKLNVLGAFFGTVFSIPTVYFFGERGIAYSLVIVSVMNILTSWWYSRKIDVPPVTLSWRESIEEAKPLLRLGFALMLGTVMIAGTQYLLRVLVVRHDGLDAAGIFHASTTLSSIYVGMILNAMITDFYPRLSSIAHDHAECTSLINKQIEVGLLLAIPGILGIMTFAPFVITLFYSTKFMAAVAILRWQIIGVLLQVISWPMGFMLRAKGNGRLFFWTELYANSTYLAFAWLGMKWFGLPGVGMAFLAMNVSYQVLIFLIIRRHYKFVPTAVNIRLIAASIAATVAVFVTPTLLPGYENFVVNSVITIVVGLYALRELMARSSTQKVPAVFLKIKARFSS